MANSPGSKGGCSTIVSSATRGPRSRPRPGSRQAGHRFPHTAGPGRRSSPRPPLCAPRRACARPSSAARQSRVLRPLARGPRPCRCARPRAVRQLERGKPPLSAAGDASQPAGTGNSTARRTPVMPRFTSLPWASQTTQRARHAGQIHKPRALRLTDPGRGRVRPRDHLGHLSPEAAQIFSRASVVGHNRAGSIDRAATDADRLGAARPGRGKVFDSLASEMVRVPRAFWSASSAAGHTPSLARLLGWRRCDLVQPTVVHEAPGEERECPTA